MKPIYLEPDEEITSVIDKLSNIVGDKIAVVVPKNSTMFQSLVNLKLLARQAKKLGKTIVIISTNKVGARLAQEVGLESYASLGAVSSTPAPVVSATPTKPSLPYTLPDGTPVHRYSPDAVEGVAMETAGSVEEPEEVEPTPVEEPDPEVVDSKQAEVEAPEEQERPVQSPASSEPPALPPIISRGIKTSSDSHFVFPWKSATVASAMLLIAVVITFLFLPKATVTLTFPANLLSETFSLAAKTSATASDGVISGNLLTVEKTGTKDITATGKKDIGTKASGTMAVKNCEDTNSHTLAAGTKATASSKVFLTASTVTIPAGQFSGGGTVCNSSSVSVTVTASDAGEAYNLSNATFTLAGLPSRISGTGSTTGGTTKQITVLSQDDLDKGYSDLKTQLTQDGTSELKDKANSQTVIDAAIKQAVIEQKVDKEVGAQTDNATASITLDLFTIAFDQAAIDSAAKDHLSQKLEANQQLIIPSDKKPTLVFKDISDDKTVMDFDVNASGFAAPSIDKTTVAKSVRNKSVSSAESMLKTQYQAQEVRVEIIPGWWLKRLPILSQAISVEYGFNALPGT